MARTSSKKPSIDRSSHLPLHIQLRDALLARMSDGELTVGSRLPPIRALIKRYGVSLPVVRMALDGLERDRILRIEHGRGCFVERVPAVVPGARKALFLLCGRSSLDPYFSRLLCGCERAAAAAGWSLVFSQASSTDPGLTQQHLQMPGLASIVMTGDVDENTYQVVSASGVPFVLAGGRSRQEPTPADVWMVGSDNRLGGWTATRELLATGHRRIAIITGPTTMRHWHQRRLGYEQALREAGLEPNARFMLESPVDTSEAAEVVLAPLLKADDAPTALFAGNDRYALAAYRILQAEGKQVGQHVSVVGYDDLDFAAVLSPPLTTIATDIENIGTQIFTMLKDAVARGVPRQELCSVRLVRRGSVGPPARS
jgi:LacI family transcriptional regulator